MTRTPATAILVLFAAASGGAVSVGARSAEVPTLREITVTLQPDGERCRVREVTFACSQLAAHLRDTLKLPYDTLVHLRAGRTANHESVRKVLTLIEESGFRHPVAMQPSPKASR